MIVNRIQVLALAAVLLVSSLAGAAVTVPSIIGNHMVLQQGVLLPIWGKADPGESVTVTLGKCEAAALAGPDGKWMVKLPKQGDGGPFEMTIKGKDNTITLTDVLVGEVWLASGQSNMQMALENTDNAHREIVAADYPKIRLFRVESMVSSELKDDCKGEWVVCTPQTTMGFSAVAYYYGRELHKTLKRPVGLIHGSWGGTPAEAWTSRFGLESDPELKCVVEDSDMLIANYPVAQAAYDKTVADWEKAAAKAKASGQPEPEKPQYPHYELSDNQRAGYLYNAMIHPLAPFAIQGAIWYQGESNGNRGFHYRKLFPGLIRDWHRTWGQGDFAFYFVQLANFHQRSAEPGPSDWAEVREAQAMTLSTRNTGMAVAIDIGDANDIHPKNKLDVGKRLALNALANTYGKKVEFSGPMLKAMKIDGNKVILTFTHAKGLSAKGGAIKGFSIAGDDQKFVWANAVIKGETVEVSSDKIEKPASVRYGWAENPECNLYNGVSLPASPFRTDDWKCESYGRF